MPRIIGTNPPTIKVMGSRSIGNGRTEGNIKGMLQTSMPRKMKGRRTVFRNFLKSSILL